ncbi:tail fiber domain-containing protein [uncultured Algibacter sp.]|uniref:tail fiber domain-containing protein n=1 Tax=uncultured Algibacter sp. TaxID=298659 RepID=UPI002620E180|nr:tail fiber domain-containing protein [uncultured Algibacter sp.]
MKPILTFFLTTFLVTITFGQKGINYKALIKDDSNNVLSNQNITIEFSILEGPEIDFLDVLYTETHAAITDANGIVIVNIGEGTPSTGFDEHDYEDLDWGHPFFSHFLKVQIDSGSGLINMGTTEFKAVPYALFALNSKSTGLEQIDEGGGIGWRLIGRNPEFYGSIANSAVDLSINFAPSTTHGATGRYSTALGYQTTASGYGSFASGINTIASQSQATAIGAATTASGVSSTAMGIGTRAEAPNSTAIGLYNIGGGDPLLASSTDPLFEIGNGNYVDGTNDNRTNALTVLRNGTITAPSFDISEITDDKALITKEYADTNYSGGSGASTGLEAINEGNGIGWRLLGRDPVNYGNIGSNAIDLSDGFVASSVYGATGGSSFALGRRNTASNLFSFVGGFDSRAIGYTSFSYGYSTMADAYKSIAFGNRNIGGGNSDSWIETDPLFEIGNGTSSIRSNALTILKNGTIKAPSFDIAEITDNKALITKEYLEANISIPKGIEAIDEGNGTGWRLIGRDPANYGNIGSNAIDLSDGFVASSVYGATGGSSFALGRRNTASNSFSFVGGFDSKAIGYTSFSYGYSTMADAYKSIAFGNRNIGGGNSDSWIETDPLFEIGNGTSSIRSNAFTILKNGNATLAGTLTQNSDKRLKINIEDMPYGLHEILQMNPVFYNWKRYPEKRKSLGLIAQDVQTIINEIVHQAKDKDKTLSVSYTELIPVIIKAIQQQQDIIENQNTKIEDLSAQINQFEDLSKRITQLESLNTPQ